MILWVVLIETINSEVLHNIYRGVRIRDPHSCKPPQIRHRVRIRRRGRLLRVVIRRLWWVIQSTRRIRLRVMIWWTFPAAWRSQKRKYCLGPRIKYRCTPLKKILAKSEFIMRGVRWRRIKRIRNNMRGKRVWRWRIVAPNSLKIPCSTFQCKKM